MIFFKVPSATEADNEGSKLTSANEAEALVESSNVEFVSLIEYFRYSIKRYHFITIFYNIWGYRYLNYKNILNNKLDNRLNNKLDSPHPQKTVS